MGIILEIFSLNKLIVIDLFVSIVKAIAPSRLFYKEIKGQTVLVTGAGSGIGKLLSERFAKLGCRLVLWDINQSGLSSTESSCKSLGADVTSYTIDLSKREDVYKVANQMKQAVGEVDILMNNAGIVTGQTFNECPDPLMEKTMQVNTMAHFWTVKAFLPGMLQRNRGHIVTIASGAGLFGVPRMADYCASKFAAVGFDESLRYELMTEEKDVKTTVVCPYFINTGMFDGVQTRFPRLLPILEADYVADKIVDAVRSDQAILLLPRILYIVYALKGILPMKTTFALGQFFGTNSSMNDFKGRTKED